jgi:hypothetical protein
MYLFNRQKDAKERNCYTSLHLLIIDVLHRNLNSNIKVLF